MLRYRIKLRLWLGMAVLMMALCLTLLHTGYIAYGVFRDNKMLLKRACRRIRAGLEAAKVDLRQPLPQALSFRLQERLELLNDDERLACLIMNNDGKKVFQNQEFLVEPTSYHWGEKMPYGPVSFVPRTMEDRQYFINGVDWGKSHGDFNDILENWHAMERLTIAGGAIFLERNCTFELVNVLIDGMFLSVPVSLVFWLITDCLFRRRLFRPIDSIQMCLNHIREGDLSARIAVPEMTDEMRTLIEQLNDTLNELESLVSQGRQFSSDAAHELRTPLTILRGELEVALGQVRSQEDYQIALADTLEEVVDMSQVVDTLLLMCRMEIPDATRMELNVTELLKKSIEWMKVISDSRAQVLACSIEEGVVYRSVPGLLERVFRNLLTNAMAYSADGGRIEVILTSRQYGGFMFRVKDYGMGIAPENHDKIFLRFFRTKHEGQSGHGLGLPLVKHIVELHGGRITVSSELGKGAEFTVEM